jgi:hypothetical protein
MRKPIPGGGAKNQQSRANSQASPAKHLKLLGKF